MPKGRKFVPSGGQTLTSVCPECGNISQATQKRDLDSKFRRHLTLVHHLSGELLKMTMNRKFSKYNNSPDDVNNQASQLRAQEASANVLRERVVDDDAFSLSIIESTAKLINGLHRKLINEYIKDHPDNKDIINFFKGKITIGDLLNDH